MLEAPDKVGLEYLYTLGHPWQVTPDVIERNFPGCMVGEVGQMDLFSDMMGGEFHGCPVLMLHLGSLSSDMVIQDVPFEAFC